MTADPAKLYPTKNERVICPGRVYDGGLTEIGLTYEQLMEIVNSIRSERPASFGHIRILVHEAYGFSDGRNNVENIAKKIGFEFGFEIEGRALMPLMDALHQKNVLVLRREANKQLE
jgi:hypothetical protein